MGSCDAYDDCNGEDVGGYLADRDFGDTSEFQLEYERKKREKALAGKFVITCQSRKNNQRLFYQDRNLIKDCFWTKFKSNAFGFYSEIAARAYCKRLRYNKPKVWYINPNTLELEDV